MSQPDVTRWPDGFLKSAYEIGAGKMSESTTTGATSEALRNVAAFLDALTETSRVTGVLLTSGQAEIDGEGVAISIHWSAADETYIAEVR